MAVAFFDSSALVKLLVEEDQSDIAATLWDEADTVIVSRLAHPEVAAALSAAGRANRLDREAERLGRRLWDDYRAATRLVELTPAIAERAAALSADLVLGGADAVHLASALTLADADPVLATWDSRLWTAASQVGLTVAPAAI